VPPLGVDLASPGVFVGFLALILGLLLFDLQVFARGRQPSFREALWASVGWLVLSLAVAIAVMALGSPEDAIHYTTVYLIERSLSLDNLVVFLILFAYYGIPEDRRPRLLFWGIIAALVLRGLAILGGTALIEQFHFVVYILGVTLLILAYRIARGVEEAADPERNVVVRSVRRLIPRASVAVVATASIVAADIAFAVDSIPAAFAITTNAEIIWLANAFALLGLRALFVLVEGLVRRFRYLDETIGVVLGLVGVKLLTEDLVEIGPVVSLAFVVVAFAVGIVASLLGDRREARAKPPELPEEPYSRPTS
jgi:tellurite resistance protein TerC